jgi:hypothetical protein
MEKKEIKETHRVDRSGDGDEYQESTERTVETSRTSSTDDDDAPKKKKVEITEETTTETTTDEDL